MKLIEQIPFNSQLVIGSRAKIGVVVLATDYTLEHEFRKVLTMPGIDFYCARIPNATTITPETLAAMKQNIQQTTSLILPGEQLDVVAYGCTSATTVLGEDVVHAEIRQVQPDAACTTPVTAAFAAFESLSVKKLAVLTPYRRDVNEAVARCFTSAGYQIPVFGSFNEEQDPIVATIDVDSIRAAIKDLLKQEKVDAVFISCTSVRFLESVAALEDEIGLPVITSNQAMAWHCLRLAGEQTEYPQFGQLYNYQMTDMQATGR